ncbi:hypothetical protein AYX13_06999 [Cryptococcus neoformans]|nr:hypothetical protein AYX13_06999 [Cryptococcus neoformans var. grubii]
MEDTSDGGTRYKVVLLEGSENYAAWSLSVKTCLVLKSLRISTPVKTASDIPSSTALDKAARTCAIIIQSLSPTVTSGLSDAARDINNPDPELLWNELKDSYSATVGARRAQLIQQMWNNPTAEGDDCMKKLSEVRSAHAQIKAAGDWNEDIMLAYAMTFTLPDSWDLFKQNLWLRDNLTSANVQAAVQAECLRRNTTASANKATGQRSINGQLGNNNNCHEPARSRRNKRS